MHKRAHTRLRSCLHQTLANAPDTGKVVAETPPPQHLSGADRETDSADSKCPESRLGRKGKRECRRPYVIGVEKEAPSMHIAVKMFGLMIGPYLIASCVLALPLNHAFDGNTHTPIYKHYIRSLCNRNTTD